jgi:two-component system, NtrC family, sensor histidine kinase HydH
MERSLAGSIPARIPQGRGQPPLTDFAAALFADAESGVLVLDPDGRIHDLNPAAEQLFGVTRARARGRPGHELVRTLVPGDDPVRDGYRRLRTEREAVLATPSGAELPVQLRGYRIGQPPWLVLAISDQTRVRRMQQELRRHERLATLGQLAAGVAHEIRNPLAGIGTSAQVLLRRFEPRDERARFVTVILDEVSRLDRIVTSLLQYARPRVPELKPSGLEPCIERVRQLAADAIEQARVTVEVDASPGLGVVWIDADLVTQVLLNVTLNAVQAMPDGGTLRYEVRRLRRRVPARGPGRRDTDLGAPGVRSSIRAGSPRWLGYQQVRVIDTGVGMPKGVLAKLFDPFFTTKAGGTGLGLSISQTIMHEHGGSIAVASREGKGTTVLLDFPVEKRHGERRGGVADRRRAGASDRR